MTNWWRSRLEPPATKCNFRLRGIRPPDRPRSGALADAGERKGAPSAKKFAVSLYFKGLRRKNRGKAGRKPAKRKAKAGEKQGRFGVGIRRTGSPRFDAAGQAGARRRGDADMRRGSDSAICDCRTPGLAFAGPGWVGGRWGNAFSPVWRSGDDVGKIIVHPLPNVKHKIRTFVARIDPPWIPAFAGMTERGGPRRGPGRAVSSGRMRRGLRHSPGSTGGMTEGEAAMAARGRPPARGGRAPARPDQPGRLSAERA